MRFWITKNSEVAVREQLVRQVVLGILSEDLPAGNKLPSVRALARRHGIHSNTVSAAYHDLMAQGWLELRKGSGLYVRPLQPAADGEAGLDCLLTSVLQAARGLGYEPQAVLSHLENLVRPRTYERIVIAEPEPAMRDILLAEIKLAMSVSVEAMGWPGSLDASTLARSLVVALPTRAIQARRNLPSGVLCVPLRLRSVERSLAGESRPAPNSLIAIVSRSAEIRKWAQAMLIAVGIDPQSLLEIDTGESGWRDRLALSGVIVADVVTAGELPPNRVAKVFRVVADSSLAEISRICARQ